MKHVSNRPLGGLCLLLLLSWYSHVSFAQQKNVLIVMADDFNHWIQPVGYYPEANTPNINALANQGVLFRDASSPSPVCVPSRNAIMSGVRASTSGIDSNQGGYIRDVPGLEGVVTMNQYFTQQGYYTYGGGKVYHEVTIGDRITDPDNWTDFTTQNPGGGPAGDAYAWTSDANRAFSWSGHDRSVENTGGRKLARHFADQLKSYDRNQPFFMAVGLFRPHLPHNLPRSYFDEIDAASLPNPPGMREGDLDDTPYSSYVVYDEMVAEGQFKNALRAYLASMKYTDDNVGIILDGLRDNANQNVLNNTIIVFMGDHGWNVGEKDHVGKGTLYDQSSRTTLVIYDPSAAGNQQVSEKVVSLQDVYPTLIELCNLPVRNDVEGNSLAPLLQQPTLASWDEPILITHVGRDVIKTNEWRYVKETNNNNHQLYNIANDPYEFDNLINDAQYDGVVAELEAQIAQMKADGEVVRERIANGDTTPPVDSSGLDISDLAATETRCDAVTLNWSDVDGETGYRIRRFLGDSAVNLPDVAANTTTYTDTTPQEGVSYDYVVRALVDQEAVGSSNRLTVNVPACDELTPDPNPSGARVRVLGPTEGIPRSTEYQVSVSDQAEAGYQEAHVHYTEAREKDDAFGSNGYIAGYRMSYVNFEFEDGEAFVKVKIPGQNVPDVEVRPTQKNVSVSYATEDGLRIARLTFPAPTTPYLAASYVSVVPLVNGEADLTNALGIFANPFADPPAEGAVVVEAGSAIPAPGQLEAGQTVVFGPGVHELGIEYPLKSEVDYFFSNGAYVKGTFQELKGNDPVLSNVRVYGYGILSTTHLNRFRPDGTKFEYNPVQLLRSSNVTVEGITLEDPSHHTLNIGGFGDLEPSYVRKVKILGWRANGDGIHIIGRGVLEDCFLRTQDDAMYIAAGMTDVQIRRMVTWNDFNGSSFIFTANDAGGGVTVSDCDVIYARSRFTADDPRWDDYDGGNVFNLRGLGSGKVIENVTVQDIRIDDEAVERSIFKLNMTPSLNEPGASGFAFRNITFRNIRAVAPSKFVNIIRGFNGSTQPENITFDCVRIGDQVVTDFSDWQVSNVALSEITFSSCQANEAARAVSSTSAPEDALTVYPNPTSEQVTLSGAPEALRDIRSVVIYDVAGRVAQRPEYTGRPIDVSTLDAGMYILVARSPQGETQRASFLIER